MLAVRELEVGDTPGLIALCRAMQEESPIYQRFSFHPAKVEHWAQLCLSSPDWFCLVAHNAEGEMVGFVAAGCVELLFSEEKTVDDLALYVAPRWRGTTAAVRMVRQLLNWSVAKGARLVRMGVTTGTNPEQAARFLERFGFRQTGLLMEYVC